MLLKGREGSGFRREKSFDLFGRGMVFKLIWDVVKDFRGL